MLTFYWGDWYHQITGHTDAPVALPNNPRLRRVSRTPDRWPQAAADEQPRLGGGV